MTRSEAGYKGYIAALWSTNGQFHKMGGEVAREQYFYTSPVTGNIGREAGIEDGVFEDKGKKHRYSMERPNCCKYGMTCEGSNFGND